MFSRPGRARKGRAGPRPLPCKDQDGCLPRSVTGAELLAVSPAIGPGRYLSAGLAVRVAVLTLLLGRLHDLGRLSEYGGQLTQGMDNRPAPAGVGVVVLRGPEDGHTDRCRPGQLTV